MKPNFDSYSTAFSDHNAYWLAHFADLAYCSEEEIIINCNEMGMTQTLFLNEKETDTQAFVTCNETAIVVAFRGTETDKVDDWMTDLKISQCAAPLGEAHTGFTQAWQAIADQVNEAIEKCNIFGKDQSLWFTGHSMGGALANVAVADRVEKDLPIDGLYTFGQPRVLDRQTASTYNQVMKDRTFRFVNNNDIFTRMPPRIFDYSHVGTLCYFDQNGEMHHDIGWWHRFLDRIKGRLNDFLNIARDGVEDHSMTGYIALIARRRGRR